MFAERPAGQPQAIQVWFYPGDRIGEEFVYPKRQAMQIAKATKKGVLATEGGGVTSASEQDRIAAMKGMSVTRVDENGNPIKDEPKAATTTASTSSTTAGTTAAPANTATGSRPSRAESTTAKADTAPRSTTGVGTAGTQNPSAANNRRRLPRTGSNLVALELLSALSLGGAFGMRRLRRYVDAR